MPHVASVTSVDFAAAARTLAATARRCGLTAPSYRSPPRLVGVDRTLRRRGDAVVVSIRLKGRPEPAVLADMVEGVVAANELVPPRSDRVRSELWHALESTRAAGATDSSARSHHPHAARPTASARSGGRPAEHDDDAAEQTVVRVA